jgi:hypothetical protein
VVQQEPSLERLRQVRYPQAADEELVHKEVTFRHGAVVASLVRRQISYLRRHELNSVVRVGVLRQPSPLLRHLLLGFSWPQALAYLQCIGRALYIVFPYCHLDHEPPMALKDGSAHTDQTTSLDHVTPCAG